MILYHGSNQIVSSPIFGYGRKDNDYGRGFYCTESIELAKEWACRNGSDGFVNTYSLDSSGLKKIDLNSKDSNILNWLAVLIDNRVFEPRSQTSVLGKQYILDNYLIDLEGYDIVCGYRADDSYFNFARDFLENVIPLSKLSEAMNLGDLGRQVMLKSEKAFDRIAFSGCEKVPASTYAIKRRNRDCAARDAYGKMVAIPPKKDDIYLMDLITGRAEL